MSKYQLGKGFSLGDRDNPTDPKEFFKNIQDFLKTAVGIDFDEYNAPFEEPYNLEESNKFIIKYGNTWNLRENLEKYCMIIARSDKLAFVKIIGTGKSSIVSRIYRLEHLKPINK